jgi:NTP pyrophosphatase (non-canonical NTP hydrolase)
MPLLDPEYGHFALDGARHFASLGVTMDRQMLLLASEFGEVIEEYEKYAGVNVRKPATGQAWRVVDELADLVMCSLVLIAGLGFDPEPVLQKQADKVRSRFPELEVGK